MRTLDKINVLVFSQRISNSLLQNVIVQGREAKRDTRQMSNANIIWKHEHIPTRSLIRTDITNRECILHLQ